MQDRSRIPDPVAFQLGGISATLKAMDEKIKNQNGNVEHLAVAVESQTKRIDQLPCGSHTSSVNRLLSWIKKHDESQANMQEYKVKTRIKYSYEMKIAVVSAGAGGSFVLLGVWLAHWLG